MKIVIPVLNDAGLDSNISDHFGRVPYYLILEIDNEGKVKNHSTIPNISEHRGGIGKPADHIIKLEPDAIVAKRMGPRAINLFQKAKIAVLKTGANNVINVISAYKKGELLELTEGCLEARHPE